MDAKIRTEITDAMARAILLLANEPKKDNTPRWRAGPIDKSYNFVASLGQVHVNIELADGTMAHYGFGITVFDYGEPKTKTVMRDQLSAKDAEIEQLKAELASR